jgi:AbiV family abortive infection protein
VTKKTLNPYSGALDPSQIADGMNAAAENSRRLVADAKLLLDAGSYPTAASLAILAIEETGKLSVLRQLAVESTPQAVAAAWKSYRTHTQKNIEWIAIDLFKKGARTLEELRPMVDPTSDHPAVLDSVKQLGLYTDCLGKAHWSRPTEIIDEQLARSLVEIATIKSIKKSVSKREVELWIEHMGPVFRKDMRWMKQALVNWHQAMVAEGLATEGAISMAEFVKDRE